MKHRAIYKIKVLNFDEHNSKAIGKSNQWFRCAARLARSPKFLALSSGAKHMWLWLLCEATLSATRECWVNPRDVSSEVHVKPKSIPGVLQELVSLEWIQILTSPTEVRKYGSKEVKNDVQENLHENFFGPNLADPPKPKKLRATKSPAPAGVQETIALYCELWGAAYNSSSPHISGMVVGQIKTLVKDFGASKAQELIRSYLEMRDRWFLTKRHSISVLLENLNVVSHYQSTGKIVTQAELRQMDSAISTENTLDALRKGEI